MARSKQADLPGMERPTIKKIDQKAEIYVEKRDARMRLLTEEMEAHDDLLAIMKEHGLPFYEFDGYRVDVLSKEKVKVKKSKDEEADDE